MPFTEGYQAGQNQGLFFYNAFTADSLPSSPCQRGFYYNRNRWHSPKPGRFVSRDPNGACDTTNEVVIQRCQLYTSRHSIRACAAATA